VRASEAGWLSELAACGQSGRWDAAMMPVEVRNSCDNAVHASVSFGREVSAALNLDAGSRLRNESGQLRCTAGWRILVQPFYAKQAASDGEAVDRVKLWRQQQALHAVGPTIDPATEGIHNTKALALDGTSAWSGRPLIPPRTLQPPFESKPLEVGAGGGKVPSWRLPRINLSAIAAEPVFAHTPAVPGRPNAEEDTLAALERDLGL